MPHTLPTIVLVPGAWHSPIHYQDLTTLLQEAGYPVISKALPSLNPPDPDEVSASDDTAFIRDTLLAPLLSEGKEVLLIAHSYAGLPAGVAAKGLSITERRAAGETGGVIGLLYIVALLVPQGKSLKSAVGGRFHPWVEIDSPTKGYLTTTTPLNIFYHDVDPLKAALAIQELRPVSAHALSTPAETAAAWADAGFQDRRAYVRCMDDRGIPVEAQDGMMAASEVEWDVYDFATSHSPFLSQPAKLAELVVGLAGKWSSGLK